MTQELVISTAELPAKPTDTLVLYAGPGPQLSQEGARLWEMTGLDFARHCAAAKFTAKPRQLLEIVAPPKLDTDRLLIIGTPAPDADKAAVASTPAELGGSLMARLQAMRAEQVTVVLDGEDMTPEVVAGFAAGLRLRHYRFDRYKTKKDITDENGEPKRLTVTLAVSGKKAADKAIADRMATVEGTLFARDLVNEPPNTLGPIEFADHARELSDLGVDVDILTEDEMEKLGMGALLAVARGSARPARLVVMQWHGGRKKDAALALVGKGVVFDTGGISIKPAGSMEDMKGDMGGAAAVVGTIKALAVRKAKANVVGVIGLVENMPDGNAYRPGDIVTSMSGQTIEIINTDAEGRLVLADALWYTQDRFKPRLMVNLATLTGAIMVGLGKDYAGLFSNDDDLARNLFEAGMASGEKVWRLPMGPSYDKLIDSRFADMKNTGGRYGGSITAAQFLKRFVNNTAWAHLDIAGAAFGAATSDINASWAPGFGVALLDELIRGFYEG